MNETEADALTREIEEASEKLRAVLRRIPDQGKTSDWRNQDKRWAIKHLNDTKMLGRRAVRRLREREAL